MSQHGVRRQTTQKRICTIAKLSDAKATKEQFEFAAAFRATAEQRSVDKAKDEAGRSTFDYNIPDNEKDDYIEFMTAAKPLAMHLAKNKISEATKLISLLWGVKSGYVHLTEICKYVEYTDIFIFH